MADNINVPVNKDNSAVNKFFKNVENLALDIRRDNDTVKNFSITLLDIDSTILDYINNVISPTVIESGVNTKVATIFSSPERWVSIHRDGYMRDSTGKAQCPIATIKRDGFERNENLRMFNRYQKSAVITKFTEKNKYDTFNLLNSSVAPAYQLFNVNFPTHVKIEYSMVIWTDYVEQMNAIIEKMNWAAEDYWGKDRFRFRVSIGNYSDTVELNTGEDRIVRSEFTLTVYSYLLAESFEDRKQTFTRTLTPKKVNVTGELSTTNPNGESVVDSKYVNLADGVLAGSGEEYRLPTWGLDGEFNVESAGGKEVVETIRQSYSNMMNSSNLEAPTRSSIWHGPPKTPNDPGEEGWMAYDGNYHYIYVGGKWKRNSISNFS